MNAIGAVNPIPDLTDDFFQAWNAAFHRLGVNPIDAARVAFAETALKAHVFHPGSNAGGIIGFMPSTLKGLGWTGTPEEFRQLTAAQQVPWVEKYYRPYAPWMKNDALVYVANFTPALLKQAAASDSNFVLAGRDGPRSGIYQSNQILDRNHDGLITVGDLSQHLNIMDKGARYDAIINKLKADAPSSSSSSTPWLLLSILGLGTLYGYGYAYGYPSWFPKILRI